MDTYYQPQDLARFAEVGEDAPALWQAFMGWYGSVFAEGALTEREKALIALAVAHAVQCPYCIDAYTKTCLEQGADLEQMTEAIHVAAAIRGGRRWCMGCRCAIRPSRFRCRLGKACPFEVCR